MSTNTETSAAPQFNAPATIEPKRTRGPLNQGQLRALTRAEAVCAAAQITDYSPALTGREITADTITELSEKLSDARDKASEAVHHTNAGRSATIEESKAGKLLEAGLREIQKAAKQKYARTNRVALGGYLVGKALNGNRPNLLQTSQTIFDQASTEALPGVSASRLKSLKARRDAWIGARAVQIAARTAATTARASLKTLLKEIENNKVAIQLAADAEWPHQDEANSGIRREFGLPKRRPLTV